MPIVLSSTAGRTGLSPDAFRSKAPLQMALGYNEWRGTRTFPARSQYEEVPGKLRAYIKPLAIGNTMMIRAHLNWGGWYGTNSVDVGANFRVYKSYDDGFNWIAAGNYGTAASPAAANCATGYYRYNLGNTDASCEDDQILISDTVTSLQPTIYAILWACSYEASTRTLYWNIPVNWGNAYNYTSTHTCTIEVTEIKA
jgi:hypothetical protein